MLLLSMEEFQGAGLIASFFVSGAGFVLFTYGKRMTRAPQMLAGAVLVVAPYFFESALGMLVTAALIGVATWVALRWGW